MLIYEVCINWCVTALLFVVFYFVTKKLITFFSNSKITVGIKTQFPYLTLKVQFFVHCTYRYQWINIQIFMNHSIHFLIHHQGHHNNGSIKTLSSNWLNVTTSLCIYIKYLICAKLSTQCIWGVEVHLHIFLICALDLGQWYLHTAAIVSPRKTTQIRIWWALGASEYNVLLTVHHSDVIT
jgi:hypothetical protein